jgi:hypothetical protein
MTCLYTFMQRLNMMYKNYWESTCSAFFFQHKGRLQKRAYTCIKFMSSSYMCMQVASGNST